MHDRKITVTDEMARAALACLREYGYFPTLALLHDALTTALDAAPTTDPAHDIDWQKVAERHEDTIEALSAERDEAIAHDRQPYPTAHAYEAACDALAEQRVRVEKAEQERDEAVESTRYAMRSSDTYRKAWEECLAMTARDHLDAAWEAAYVPEDGVIPARSRYISRDRIGKTYVVHGWHVTQPAVAEGLERRLLDPPTPKRPDGAEEIESALRGELSNLIDENGRFHGSIDGINGLADRLASRGVRVTETEETR